MPDHNVTGKRLHLERMAAIGLGDQDAARNLVQRVVSLSVAEREDALKSLAMLFGMLGVVIGFIVGYLL